MPYVSVIVPVYQVSAYLRECLESLAQQIGVDIEVIIIDDGSTDGSAEICDEFVVKDSRFRVLHKPNEGLVRARKDGLAEAKGEYVGFVDGDDWVEPTMFSVLADAAERSGADVVGCNFTLEYSTSSKQGSGALPSGSYQGGDMARHVHPLMLSTGRYGEYGVVPAVWCKMFRRSLILRHLPRVPDSVRNGEDGACTYPLLMEADSLVLVEDALYHYRQHPDQMVRANPEGILDSLTVWVPYLHAAAREHGVAVMHAQITYYTQVKVVELLANVARASSVRGVAVVLSRVWADPVLRAEAASANRFSLPREGAVALRLSSRGAWRVGVAAYLAVRGMRAGVRWVRGFPVAVKKRALP